MTEFGAVDNSPDGVENINFLLNDADKYFQSWSYWQFKSFNDITTQGTFWRRRDFPLSCCIDIFKSLLNCCVLFPSDGIFRVFVQR